MTRVAVTMKISVKKKIIFLIVIFIAAIFFGISKGSADIPFIKLLGDENRAILMLRLLRVVMAVLVGSGLAVSGIVLQSTLRNPLADPYLLGTSSGAGLGAACAAIFGIGQDLFPVAAFLGAVASIILVYLVARQGGKIPAHSLILSGVIVSIALSGIMVFLISISPDEALHGLMWWIWGSLEVFDLRLILAVSIIVGLGIFVVYIFSQDLNAMSIGEEEAIHLGIHTETVKKLLLVVTALITASLVCIAGIIGFVGLVVPHMMRFIVGPNHKALIPASCLGAAAFMMFSDTIGHAAFSPLEIPIGVVTAIVGAPVFIVLLKVKQKII
ncbi:MAG: iron ABC transporter permease [Candidatus Omnitrophica bacterium]|nr:iron ABC transporter permease [Candidatus Omnitrophota bacterium]